MKKVCSKPIHVAEDSYLFRAYTKRKSRNEPSGNPFTGTIGSASASLEAVIVEGLSRLIYTKLRELIM